jgi:sugar transferase (PEP-CTERM/EpsH1 system associated)
MEEFLYRAGPWATTFAEHNWPVLVYVPLILWVAVRALVRPERQDLLLLYGLAILAVTFEYQKHGTRIVSGTVRYLFSAEQSPFMRAVSEFVLVDAAPVAGHALGLSLVVIAVALPGLRGFRHRSPPKSSATEETESGEAEDIAPPVPRTDRLRILYVLPYVPSLIRVRPYHLIRELARRHEIHVLAASTRLELPYAEHLRSFCSGVDVVPLRAGASAGSCFAAALRGEPLQAAVCRVPELERRLDAILAEHAFDVVHVEHLRAAHLRPRIPSGLPTLFDSVDCISLLLDRARRASHSLWQRVVAVLELQRTRAFEAGMLPRFDRVMATSTEDAAALQALAPSIDVAVVPNGVDLDYFRPADEPREPATIVFSGKMSYHANATAALYFASKILPLIRTIRPDARLRIVGSGPPRSVRALSRDPDISVTGYLPDIRDGLRGAAVAVCPISVKVGIQNKILEAMAMGIPVVSTTRGIEGLGAVPGRDVMVADSPAEFAAHVGRLIGDPALGERVGQAGRRYVELHHRWDATARKVETLYTEAIERRAHSWLPATQPGSRSRRSPWIRASWLRHGRKIS